MTSARVVPVHVPRDPTAQVLVLHGGGARRHGVRVSPTQLSVVRMVPIARRIALGGRDRLAVFRLLNSSRGWDAHHTPVHDVAWALGQLRSRLGRNLPTGLVGHSLGGRAALLSADEPSVRSVVALAPWVYATDGRRDLSGRRVLLVHGTEDHIASPARSSAVASDLRRTAEVGYICIEGGRHAMVRHHHQFDGYAAEFTRATLLDDTVSGPVARVLAGETWVDV
ncbi:alpha/beta hydrolase [Nocardioides euryhalodurans]|uniref:Alpha/beta hydrolase n=1 Tax=Nocardioides euryhalodurans TaxID=2518370 RepID=A0A4V1BE41_9ACTN|nr:alpha/beta hydrolase [Nocardioides euryhalodurans]